MTILPGQASRAISSWSAPIKCCGRGASRTLIPGRPVDMTFDSGKRILAVLNTRSMLLLDRLHRHQDRRGPARDDVLRRHRLPPRRPRTVGQRNHAQRPRQHPDRSAQRARHAGQGRRASSSKAIPLPTGIAFSPDGKTAYVAFSRNNSLAVIDADHARDPRRDPDRDGALRRRRRRDRA